MHSSPPHAPTDFHQSPFLVIWETTQACDLACQHCRAEARPDRHPDELSTDEAKRMLDAVRCFGPIIFVFSGGDAMKRPDIVELVRHAANLGLRVAITPATTPLTTRQKLEELREAGLTRLAVSLDGPDPAIHDAFRGVAGSFDHGLRILETSREIGLTTQVNTVIARHNHTEFDRLAALMAELGIVFWEVFFLVPMGRARPEDLVSAEEFEATFHRLYDLSRTAPFDVKATAAPQYARIVHQRKAAELLCASPVEAVDSRTRGPVRPPRDGIGRARGVNDGDGFVFVSHVGDIYPSGFLPIRAGNLRHDDLVEVYRHAPLFRALRNRDLLKGKCGVCQFRTLCGGSRARAYAMTGDYLEAEPCCPHVPPRWQRLIEEGEAEPVERYFARRVGQPSRSLPVVPSA